MTLRFPHANLRSLARTRRRGFVAAVEAVARYEGADILVDSADWHRLTREHLARPAGLRLGDAFARLAKPVARAIDAATAKLPDRFARFRTHLAACPACSQRQTRWNTAPAAWWAKAKAALRWALGTKKATRR